MLLQRCKQAVDPIGMKRKEHKYGVIVGRVINLPQHVRDQFDSLLLLALYNVKHCKPAGGVCRMFTGIHQETGEQYDEQTLRHELELLRQGVEIEMPDDDNGGVKDVILECHFLGLCADLLGAAGAGPWPECFQAKHPCYDCWWHSKCFCAYVPAHASEQRRKGAHEPGCKSCAPRTEAETLGLIKTIATTQFNSKKAREAAMTDSGIRKLHSAIQYLPGANMEYDLRKDTMHLFLRGITPHEGLWMINGFVQDGEFTWEELNIARKKLTVPRGHKIPELYPPKSDGKPLKSQSLCLTGSGVLHFAVNRCAARLSLQHPLQHLLQRCNVCCNVATSAVTCIALTHHGATWCLQHCFYWPAPLCESTDASEVALVESACALIVLLHAKLLRRRR